MSTAFEAVGTPRFVGGTTLVPGTVGFTGGDLPTGSGTGHLTVALWGNSTDVDPVHNTAVWTVCGEAEGGQGSFAVDTGKRHVTGYWAEGASLSDPQNFTNGGPNDPANLIGGYVLRFTKTLTYWEPPAAAVAADNAGGAGFSATFNRDPGFTAGDTAILVLVANTDAVNPAGITLTLPGTTQGTGTTAVATTPTAVGNDARITIRSVTITGTSNGTAPSVASTTDFTGAALLIRVRDTNTAPTPPPVASVPTDVVVRPWIENPLDGSASSYSPGATFAWSNVTVGGTGTVVIAAPTALETTFHVDPTVWADQDYQFKLEITDAGGTSAITVTRTVLRSSWTVASGGVNKPARITMA